MIDAFEAISAINRHRGDAIVVGIMTPIRYWEHVSGRQELDLPIYGAMGKASSVALGVALACPDRRVLILDGDGSLLMNLGTLVTIAGQGPSNLVHFVFEDGVYFTTGGQPVPGAGTFDFAGMAQAAGYAEGVTFNDLEDFVGELPGILDRPGPILVCLKVSHPPDAPGMDSRSIREDVKRLKETLSRG
jgi:phosphonopyruvate decarboxylase